MFKKITKFVSFILLTTFVFSSTVFLGITPVRAEQMNSMNNEENPMGIVINESNDDKNSSTTNSSPDLGDDQAFPFIPGFGKNSGKD